jgi:hypothetical protein
MKPITCAFDRNMLAIVAEDLRERAVLSLSASVGRLRAIDQSIVAAKLTRLERAVERVIVDIEREAQL